MKSVANKLMDALITRPGKTVTALARELDMSRPALSNVLNGSADLSIDLALKIEATFGLDARRLLIQQLNEALAKRVGTPYNKRDRALG